MEMVPGGKEDILKAMKSNLSDNVRRLVFGHVTQTGGRIHDGEVYFSRVQSWAEIIPYAGIWIEKTLNENDEMKEQYEIFIKTRLVRRFSALVHRLAAAELRQLLTPLPEPPEVTLWYEETDLREKAAGRIKNITLLFDGQEDYLNDEIEESDSGEDLEVLSAFVPLEMFIFLLNSFLTGFLPGIFVFIIFGSLAEHSESSFSKEKGRLDDLVILSFSPFYETIGGLQQHLQNLNRILLERNRVTIIQMYMVEEEAGHLFDTIETKGKGTLIKVRIPLLAAAKNHSVQGTTKGARVYRLIKALFNLVGMSTHIKHHLMNSGLSALFIRIPVARKFYRHELNPGDVQKRARDIFGRFSVDVVVVHDLFQKDSLILAGEARRRGIPVIIENHGSSFYFKNIVFRRVTREADGIAGVNSRNIPSYLRSRF